MKLRLLWLLLTTACHIEVHTCKELVTSVADAYNIAVIPSKLVSDYICG